MQRIIDRLFELKDEKNKEFEAKLIPNVSSSSIIGIKVPLLRNLAKEILNDEDTKEFLNELPHKYFDENMLHGLLISQMRDFDEVLRQIDVFLPFVDNWAVCDSTTPKVFKKHKEELLPFLKKWIKSKETYRVRFAIRMLMCFYLDKDFKEEYLDIVSSVRSDEYYINMMVAWYFATALTKRWDFAIKVIEDHKLDEWTHNKAIQKARESFRITLTQKEYLKTLKY